MVKIGNVKIGGDIGENPTVLIGSVFYKNHNALIDEKTGKFNKSIVEKEVNEFLELIEETGMNAIIDVVGSYPEALFRECEYIADLTDYPFLVDGLNDSSRIPAMEKLKEVGLLDRAILNSIDENTNEESISKLKEIGVKNAVLLTFGNKYIMPKQKLKLLREKLIPDAESACIENYIVDTAVLDLPSVSLTASAAYLIKNEFGLPVGFAPSNAIYGWEFVKKYGEPARAGAIASIMTYAVNAGCDFILFGPIKFAKEVVPSIALIEGMNSYYRRRVLRKSISEKNPLRSIF
ncbi:MAG: [methyl-Co(III) glycine betaine-specific corrinoid protein]--tetrahydrofolate methyltransferase MtgA [Promethearchaeota archaeon]